MCGWISSVADLKAAELPAGAHDPGGEVKRPGATSTQSALGGIAAAVPWVYGTRDGGVRSFDRKPPAPNYSGLGMFLVVTKIGDSKAMGSKIKPGGCLYSEDSTRRKLDMMVTRIAEKSTFEIKLLLAGLHSPLHHTIPFFCCRAFWRRDSGPANHGRQPFPRCGTLTPPSFRLACWLLQGPLSNLGVPR